MTTSTKSETAAKKDVTKLQRAIVDGLEDVKAQDIQVFNTEHLSPLFERVIVATGTSNRQTKAIAASVRDSVREAGFAKPRIEGEDNGEWIIVDCGAAVAHIMQPAIRQYYRLEELWGEVPVRLKLGAAKPAKAASDAAAKKTKPAAKKSAETAAPAKSGKATAKAVAKTAAKTAEKSAAKPAAAKKAAAKTPAKPTAKTTAKTAGTSATATTKKPAAKKAPVKTVVVKPSAAKKPAAKKAATPKAPVKAASKAPAKAPAKTASKPAAKKAPARKG